MTAATPTLTGVQLQWSHLFTPYIHNFVQYRTIVNQTLSQTMTDFSTPYVTLPMVFENSHTLEFLVPRSALVDGTHYEFRLGYPFSEYTFYTNTLIAKTFDSNSPFVSNIVTSSTNSSIKMSWIQPEYSDGLLGYKVDILYLVGGNGQLTNPQWNVSTLTLAYSYRLSLTDLSLVQGCGADGVTGCLIPYTTYLVQISVIRESGVDKPKAIYVSTSQTPVEKHDTASIFVYGGRINVNFVSTTAWYNTSTAISSTMFWPAYIASQLGDIQVNLTSSLVTSVAGSNNVTLTLSSIEYSSLVSQVIASNAYSKMTLYFGGNRTLGLSVYCLLIDFFSFSSVVLTNWYRSRWKPL